MTPGLVPGNATGTPVLASFVTPHGFGHASRTCAVLEVLAQSVPEIRFEIFTTVPSCFFEESLRRPFGYHPVRTDIGMSQTSPLEEDLTATLQNLDEFLPFHPAAVDNLARLLRELHCDAVLCDISPLGIAVAEQSGIPSILLENFTWDWIYSAYLDAEPGLRGHIETLRPIFQMATHRIQSHPICRPEEGTQKVPPISRKGPRVSPEQVRRELGIPPDKSMVLITLGGIRPDIEMIQSARTSDRIRWVFPGASDRFEIRDGAVLLPHHHGFFHPDLVYASDAVVGKVGYSTLAETYHAGKPFGYIPRIRFPESAVLCDFIESHMAGARIDPAEFSRGTWVTLMDTLLNLSPRPPREENGTRAAARTILEILGG
ncbi:MAG TPA: hypothetical protein PK014_10620 [Thermoanaerobaculia bacterium]|nr:hypothetical protein [Thermoanaerobaculia bacterium]HUM30574.1 hypothetical protein [Thermoanaerobaculia bacterium]HXK68766.1 hypothetical protein [Thermoanaerobaculia bacterium]